MNIQQFSQTSLEKYRICIFSLDLNYTRYNLCGFVKDDVDEAEIAFYVANRFYVI